MLQIIIFTAFTRFEVYISKKEFHFKFPCIRFLLINAILWK